jgi:2-polyprenyl-6-hydroxyphenyl methylase/3-demethylubiquinone-9 3-methyltransferase
MNPKAPYNFAQLAPQWWDPKGPMRVLHDLNPLRISWINLNLQKTNPSQSLKNLSLLDIGCGGGILAEPLARLGAQVTGIDPEKNLIQIAKNHAKNQKLPLSYLTHTAESYAKKSSQSFDIITCMEVIEHHPLPAQLIQSCHKLLKPGGLLLLSTLNRTPKAKILAVKVAENILNIIPKHTHNSELFLKPHELSHILRKNGLSPLAASGVTYSLKDLSWKLNPHNLSINYFLAAFRPHTLPNANK